MNDKRIIYFGTNGNAGHHSIPICGMFTEEERVILEKVDCVELQGRGGWFDYVCLGHTFRVLYFPYSLDDDRPGSKTIFMIENGNIEDFREMFKNNLFALTNYRKIKKKFGYTEKEIKELFGDRLYYKEENMTTTFIHKFKVGDKVIVRLKKGDEKLVSKGTIVGITYKSYADSSGNVESVVMYHIMPEDEKYINLFNMMPFFEKDLKLKE